MFRRLRRARIVSITPVLPASGFPQKKPDWVKPAILVLQERLHLSHRKLADAFNLLYFASTGVSVGRTWVRELLLAEAYAALHRRLVSKHVVPATLPVNRIWGIDTTCVTDQNKVVHCVLGMIDHGSRWNVALDHVRRFNRFTFLGHLLLAFGRFGRPDAIKTDNHPVFRSKLVKRVLRWCGVRHRFSRPATPTDNGRIERLFGTLKSCLRNHAICDAAHLMQSIEDFRFWYNLARPHQHLGGRTPDQVWRGIDPYKAAPKSVAEFSAWNGRLKGLVLRH